MKNCVDHLQKCRPLAVSVCNAYKHINNVLTQLRTDQAETDVSKFTAFAGIFNKVYVSNLSAQTKSLSFH